MKKSLALALIAGLPFASAAGLSGTDTAFLAKAVRGNNFEIEAAKLALTMSRAAYNRQYAREMITDHTHLGAQVKAAVLRADSSEKLPTTVTYKQWDMLQQLKLSGRRFDRLYRTQMINSHRETYNLFSQYGRSRRANPGLRSVVVKAKPTVQMHWNHAYNLAR